MYARSILVTLLGAAIGASFGPVGAGIGLAVGLAAAAVWMAHDKPVKLGPQGREQHVERVLCVPYASIARCVMTRDTRTGTWLNVNACSLCSPEDKILCEKSCLVVMNDTAKRPGRWVQDESVGVQQVPAGHL